MTAYRGFGKIKAAPYDPAIPFFQRAFRDLGNNSSATLTAAEQSEDLLDYTSSAGGIDASYRRVESASGQIDARHWTPDNLAMGLWGNSTAYTGAAVASEASKVRVGAFVPTQHLIDMSVPVVVSKGGTALNTADYVVSPAGITYAATLASPTVIDGDDVTIAYTSADSYDIETLVNTAPSVSLLMELENAVNSKPLVIAIWKARLGIAQNLALIGGEYGTLPLAYTVEKDATITGVGKSQYYKVLQGG